MKLDGIALAEFSDSVAVRDLHRNRCREVPSSCGVYVLIRGSTMRPRFRRKSKAGWFKNLDPSYNSAEVLDAWVTNARIVYVGKAAGAAGLRQRVRQLVDFGFGKPIGHRGGRMLWHLWDHEALQLRWRSCSRSQADSLETRLICQFRELHGKRPFANRAK